MENNGKEYKIRCPYCNKVFNHDQVHFRISDRTIDEANYKIKQIESKKGKSLLTENISDEIIKKDHKQINEDLDKQIEYLKKFTRQSKIDEKYFEIWGKNKGGNAPDKYKDLYYKPYVDKSNIQEMTKAGKTINDPRTGFVIGIKDPLDGSGIESQTRICPFCHNFLPGRYGENEQIFISILGISEAGKTVYIKQLLRQMRTFLHFINASVDSISAPIDDDKTLHKDSPLPDSTPTLNFKIPYIFTITFKKKNGETYVRDIVLYDIAGENLIIDQRDPESQNRLKFYANFIKYSDAIITLIDPNQLMPNTWVSKKWPASQMINTLQSIFGNMAINIPSAFVISKSDTLRTDETIKKILNGKNININDSNIFNDVNRNENEIYFHENEYLEVSYFIENYIIKKISPDLDNGIKAHFEQNLYGYFASSSLIDGVEQRLQLILTPKKNWTSKDVEHILEYLPLMRSNCSQILLDALKLKENGDMNAIEEEDIEIRREFVIESRNDEYYKFSRLLGTELEKISNTAKMNTEINNIFGDLDLDNHYISLKDSDANTTKLTLRELTKYLTIRNNMDQDDVMFIDISIVGYPSSTGNLESRRIEEPLYWIFNKLNLVDNDTDKNISETKNNTDKKNSIKSLIRKIFIER